MKEINLGHKSVLAKLLASENINIQIKAVDTAYFDLQNRILVIPALKKELSQEIFNMFLAHEVSHALYTPYEAWESLVNGKNTIKIPHSLLNIIEDIRIEKLIKRKYPGLKREFYEAYQELYKRDFFGIKKLNVNELSFLDRINVYAKIGPFIGVTFTEDEQKFVMETESLETFEEVISFCVKLKEYLKLTMPQINKKKGNSGNEDVLKKLEKLLGKSKKSETPSSGDMNLNDDDGEEEKENLLDEKPPEENVSFRDSRADGKPKEPSKEKSQDQSSSDHGDSSLDDNEEETGEENEVESSDDALEKELKSITQENSQNNQQGLYDTTSKVITITIPEMHEENMIFYWDDYLQHLENCFARRPNITQISMDNLYKKYVSNNKSIIDYLAKEFDLKKHADQSKKELISKTGMLNMNKIHEYKFTDDLFKKNTVIPDGKSHGLILIVDWSGSMDHIIKQTLHQLFCMTDFCRKVQIPFEVYAFVTKTNTHKKYNTHNGHYQTPKLGDILLSQNLTLVNFLSSKMNKSQYVKMQKYYLHVTHNNDFKISQFLYMGGTPLDETIGAMLQIIPKFKNDNNLQVVNTVFLTDGDGNGSSYYYTDIDGGFKSFASGRYDYDGTDTKVYIEDPKTKTLFLLDKEKEVSGNITNILLRVLQIRTQSNVIGYFLTTNPDWYSIPNKQYAEQKSNWEKYNFIEKKNQGYTVYYIVNSDKLDIITDTLEDAKNKVVGELPFRRAVPSAIPLEEITLDSFKTLTKKATLNRILLNKFIAMIT